MIGGGMQLKIVKVLINVREWEILSQCYFKLDRLVTFQLPDSTNALKEASLR